MKKEAAGRKMPYYEFISGFRGRYKSLFGFEYSILKHPSWAGITVPSVPFPGSSAHRRWALMKIYCTSYRGLHVAFSDDWIENRSLAIALLEPTAGISQTDRMILLIVYLSFVLSPSRYADLSPQTQQFKPLDRYRPASIAFPISSRATFANCLPRFSIKVSTRFYVTSSVKIYDLSPVLSVIRFYRSRLGLINGNIY